ncbi:MAG: hypothetical protein ACJ8FY_20885 [Gemmataceae bacterium]
MPDAVFALLLLLGLSLDSQAAPAPDEVEAAKSKLAAMKSKLPELVKECLGDEKLWPVKFKGKISSLRLISPNEAKLTIRLDYVPPETTDTPPPGAGGGGRGAAGGPGFRSLQTANQVVFVYLKFFDGAWTTHQSGLAASAIFQNGINHLMAAIDEVSEQK